MHLVNAGLLGKVDLPPLSGAAQLSDPLRFPACGLTLMRGGQHRNARHSDLIFTLTGLGNVVRRLHTHQRVHLHSKGFLDTERHIPGEVGLAIEQTG
jgi:hypothetical protein